MILRKCIGIGSWFRFPFCSLTNASLHKCVYLRPSLFFLPFYLLGTWKDVKVKGKTEETNLAKWKLRGSIKSTSARIRELWSAHWKKWMKQMRNPKEENWTRSRVKVSSFMVVVVRSQCLSHHAYLLTKKLCGYKKAKT